MKLSRISASFVLSLSLLTGAASAAEPVAPGSGRAVSEASAAASAITPIAVTLKVGQTYAISSGGTDSVPAPVISILSQSEEGVITWRKFCFLGCSQIITAQKPGSVLISATTIFSSYPFPTYPYREYSITVTP
ncbi:hypothetical protein J2T17_007538 [Paenibacillus mucilaginosus]|uniref:hypothetical protein n=1 Tax=Paenibacillus mucilaginosus TaxID=61624 RepID=UPI003D2314CA